MFAKLKSWLQRRRLDKAVRESNVRMSKMPRAERDKLGEQARSIIYPQGYWTCEKHQHILVMVGVGQKCQLCEDLERNLP